MDDFSILANEPNFGNIAMCPGGVVHINLAHVSLKMDSSDFQRLARLVAEAKQKLTEQAPRPGGSPHLHVVPVQSDSTPETEDE